MLVNGKHYQSIWVDESDPSVVRVIDQQKLPFFFEIRELRSVDDIYNAISDMTIRGAPLIGAAGAFGVYLATLEITPAVNPKLHLENASRYLISCRPTAVNLTHGIKYVMQRLKSLPVDSLSDAALKAARELCENEIENCKSIGKYGLPLLESISKLKTGSPVNILTHCNAGWLACIDYGTVTAPVYLAHESGIPLHLWVDETRPRNQGARLTTWELEQAGVPYTLVTDSTGGHLMQHGMVDIIIVGCDRASVKGDVANKIGTYLKALAAKDNEIPFYVALPSTSIDLSITDAFSEIHVEERDPEEVTSVSGITGGEMVSVRICPERTRAANYGFDITPARLISGLITEKGIIRPEESEIKRLFS